MKLSILRPVVALYTLAQLGQGNAAIMAEWHHFNAATTPFPVAASSVPDPGILAASMNEPANLTKLNTSIRFVLLDWNTTSTVDASEYFEISLDIDPGYTVDFSDLQLNAGYFGISSPNTSIHIRSDADNFATDLASFNLSTTIQPFTADLSSLANQTGTRKFRFFGTEFGSGNQFRGFDSGSIPGGGFLAVSGTSTPVPEPSFYGAACGIVLLGFALWRRIRRY